MKVVVGASSFAEGNELLEELFRQRGIELVKNPFGRRLTKEEIIQHLQGADGLLAGLEPLDEEVFSQCPQLRAVARIGIGMDNVDQEAAKRYGIRVSNTPEAPTEAVAEMTVAALLALCHSLIPSNMDVHRGIWKKRMGKSITGMNVLLIGYGRIGRRTDSLLRALGVTTMIYDKFNSEVSTCKLEEGLRRADAISLHASGKEEILDANLIAQMKDGVILLNSARGGLINETALYEALSSGKVAAFWGDALWEEPYTGILAKCENAILTPHICTYTDKCRESMERQAAENLLRDLGL